jgi:hypothetical protein
MAVDFQIPSLAAQGLNRIIPRYAITPEPADETNYVSYLGTPVWSPLEFLKTSGTSLDNSLGVGEAKGNSEVLLRIDTVLMSVSQSKNIVKTPIQGRDGTIKEYISDGDFVIDIRGAIVSPYQSVYPKEDVSILEELLRLKKQIPVASEFLQLFGIDAIVAESYTISQKLGSRNEVLFEIQALSDLAEEITLNPNDGL